MTASQDTPDLPQLLLLPGFLCDADLWRDQIQGLASQARCSVADFSKGSSIRELAAQVLAQAEPNFCLAGFSFGGYVAQEILRQAPHRVSRLALLSTSDEPDTPEWAKLRKKTSLAAAKSAIFTGLGRHSLPRFLHPDHQEDKELVTRLQAMNQRLGKEVFMRQNAMIRDGGKDVLPKIKVPTLVACGDSDQVTPPDKMARLAAQIPDADFQVINKSGHMVPMEQPAAVTRLLSNWLEQQPEDRSNLTA
ncbi:alpha/beta fold hydrolase [Rhodovibrionaceae bacterium A322]